MNLSKLPAGSVIHIEREGYYVSREDGGLWYALLDHPVTGNDHDTFSSDFLMNHDSAPKVRIMSVPFGVTVQLAMMLQDEYGSVDAEGEDITFDSVIDAAVHNHNDRLMHENVKVSTNGSH